jgi:hypothetical protein
MKKRPLSITILSCLLILAGAIGLASHVIDFKAQHRFEYEMVWIILIRILAVVCGAYMLRGSNWARWGTISWLAFHVVLSAFHSLPEFAMHGLLLAVFAYFLFSNQATTYFRNERAAAT